ncbi:hypothetical protein BT96DRAFT_1019558 [Gymnopus androsaceus JB14]|uniref:Uncharacterized protein n=1 Tax=Gymnopus androsaceus JB14 TaxID=1447944 RepID=A0A6A4HPX9_9AGAR|nr:hypothetical protein BT96DRAFT_1019558 [Gymnopus androsaceus JB14]
MTTNEPKFTKFKVQSTDVLQEARINVLDEASDEIVWFKERFLAEDEIIEHLVHSSTSTVRWIIHRPGSKGWYIRIRSPSFPPGVFIPLIPVPSKSPLHSDAALSFKSRTNPTAMASTSSVHSYPPTPPAIPTLSLSPPSPELAPRTLSAEASASSAALLSKSISKPRNPSSSISEFILAPAVTPPPSTRESFFSRAINVFRYYEQDISSGYSFSLARVAVQSPPPYAPALGSGSKPNASPAPPIPPSSSPSPLSTPTCIKALPVLTFTDLTSTFTVNGSVNGMIQLDKLEAEMLGVEPSFWVAVALTYLDFLEDRGSYLASLGD